MLPLVYRMKNMGKTNILKILRSNKSVFTFKDVMLASEETDAGLLKRRINYYVKKGELYHIRRGIYAKDKDYNKLELATKIYTPSYICFETVLASEGIIFQHYEKIFVASYLSREMVCDNKHYSFRKIKDSILTNHSGIENKGNFFISSKERAFLDTVYLNKDYHFDNLSPLDWEKVFEIIQVYKNKKMLMRVKKYYKSFKSDQG